MAKADRESATGYLFTINCVVYGNRYPVAAFLRRRIPTSPHSYVAAFLTKALAGSVVCNALLTQKRSQDKDKGLEL